MGLRYLTQRIFNRTFGYYRHVKFRTKLWKRGKMSFATTIPHIVHLNLDSEYRKYNVIWGFNEKIGKRTVRFEEID